MHNAQCKMQNAKCKMQNAQCTMQNAKSGRKGENAKCKMQNAKCKIKNEDASHGSHLRGCVNNCLLFSRDERVFEARGRSQKAIKLDTPTLFSSIYGQGSDTLSPRRCGRSLSSRSLQDPRLFLRPSTLCRVLLRKVRDFQRRRA